MASISSSLIFSKEEILKAPFVQHLRPSSYTTPRLVMAAFRIIEWILVHAKNSFYFWLLIRIGPCKPHHNLDVVGVLPTSELNLGVSFSWGWAGLCKTVEISLPYRSLRTEVVLERSSVPEVPWLSHSPPNFGIRPKTKREREGRPWVSCRHCPSPCKCPPLPCWYWLVSHEGSLSSVTEYICHTRSNFYF